MEIKGVEHTINLKSNTSFVKWQIGFRLNCRKVKFRIAAFIKAENNQIKSWHIFFTCLSGYKEKWQFSFNGDYRTLNSDTESDQYPFPSVYDQINISVAKYFG